jgi:hypothetical protein
MTPFQKTEAEGFLRSYFITSVFLLGQVFSTKPVREPGYLTMPESNPGKAHQQQSYGVEKRIGKQADGGDFN